MFNYIFILFVVFVSLSASEAIDSFDKDFELREHKPFLHMEIYTENETTFSRNTFGLSTISLVASYTSPVEIGGKKIYNSKKITGEYIQIGAFFLSCNHSDKEYLNIINEWNPIVIKSLSLDD